MNRTCHAPAPAPALATASPRHAARGAAQVHAHLAGHLGLINEPGPLILSGPGRDGDEVVDEDSEADGEEGPRDHQRVAEREGRHARVQRPVLGARRQRVPPGLAGGDLRRRAPRAGGEARVSCGVGEAARSEGDLEEEHKGVVEGAEVGGRLAAVVGDADDGVCRARSGARRNLESHAKGGYSQSLDSTREKGGGRGLGREGRLLHCVPPVQRIRRARSQMPDDTLDGQKRVSSDSYLEQSEKLRCRLE